jgi:DNA-binding IclR family transcriptional regulator
VKRAQDPPDGGVQSVEVGVAIFSHLIYAEEAMSLKAIADASGTAPAKIHRYLRSFVRSGLVVQNKKTRHYDLGPLAFSLGALALKRHGIPAACDHLRELREHTGQSASLVIWGAQGPIVARYELIPKHTQSLIPIREMPVTTSAAGHLFAALLPESMTSALIAEELPVAQAPAFRKIVSETRVRRMARVSNGVVSGMSAMSAPLLGADGNVVAAVCVLGRTHDLDTSWNGSSATALMRFVSSLNAQVRSVPEN